MLKCVGFDFDGTLVQSNEIKRRTFYEVASEFHLPLEVVDQALLRGGDRSSVFGEVVALTALDERPPRRASSMELVGRLVEAYTKKCDELIADCPEVEGAKSALSRLQALGYSIFVSSATPIQILTKLLARRGFLQYCSGVFGAPTDKVSHLRAVMALRRAAAEEVLFVGDREIDRAAADSVGARFVAVVSEGNDFLSPPVRSVMSLLEIVDLVEELGSRGEWASRPPG